RMALDLIARATRRGAVDDLTGAVEDLDLAERMGAPPDSLAAARLSLADRVAEEVRTDLDAGDPARALERIEDLARNKVSGPAPRRAAPSRRSPRPRASSSCGRSRPPPRSRRCTRPSPRGSGRRSCRRPR